MILMKRFKEHIYILIRPMKQGGTIEIILLFFPVIDVVVLVFLRAESIFMFICMMPSRQQNASALRSSLWTHWVVILRCLRVRRRGRRMIAYECVRHAEEIKIASRRKPCHHGEKQARSISSRRRRQMTSTIRGFVTIHINHYSAENIFKETIYHARDDTRLRMRHETIKSFLPFIFLQSEIL